jgi:hypothetical protein
MHSFIVPNKDLLAVLCKADDPAEAYPATLPRPLVTNLALQMPLACTEPAEPAIERERLLGSLMLNEYRASAADNGTDQDDVGGLVEELEGKQFLDQFPVAFGWPFPVEVSHDLEGAHFGTAHAALQAAMLALSLLAVDELGHPGFMAEFGPAVDEAVKTEFVGPLAERIAVGGRDAPHDADSSWLDRES